MSSIALPGEDSRPLTDQERKQLTRLLSDPTLYPQTFKTWIVPFLEASDMDLPMQVVHGLLEQLGQLRTRVDVSLATGQSFRVLDHNGNPVFAVDEDGTMHGKTGKALTFDL